MHEYDEKAGIGALVSTMIPYSMVFLLVWTLFAIGWFLLGLPLGPGDPIFI